MVDELLRQRARGCLLGLAIGDALGTTLEFSARDSLPPVTDMVGGGPFHLPAGVWTDDTSMALCIARSLLHCGGFDATDMMNRFVNWYRFGQNSATGECFDIGNATRDAIERYEATRNPYAGDTDPMTAGNGSIMRLAPVALYHVRDADAAREVADRQSRLTHAAGEALEGCRELVDILVSLLRGEPLAIDPDLAARPRDMVQSSGYVRHTLDAALWATANSSTFAEAVLLAVNLAGDADTVGAVTGQIAGAMYGVDAIPDTWIERLAWSCEIDALADALVGFAGPDEDVPVEKP